MTYYNYFPGIHYENIGELRIYNDQWNLITYLNLDNLDSKLDQIINYCTSLDHYCNNINLKNQNLTFCKNDLNILDKMVTKLGSQKNVIQQLTDKEDEYHHTKFQKRSLFDGIGKVAKILFGTLDSDDAKYYENQIQKFNENEDHLLIMLKEQSHITKTTISNFNKTITSLHVNEKLLINNMKILKDNLITNSKRLNILEIKESLIEQISLLNFLTEELDKEMSNLIQAILFAQNGIIHPSILTPEQLIKNLQLIMQHIPKNTEFPIPLLIQNSHSLLKLINLHVFHTNNKLVYVIEVPLVQNYIFKLYHLTPLPFSPNKNNEFIYIQPTSEYFAIDNNNQHYLIISNNDFKDCKFNVKIYVCKQKQPVYLTHNNDNCESKLLQNLNHIPSNCEVRIIKISNNIFHQLKNSNSWLFLLTNPENIVINCKHSKDTIDLKLNNLGLISLRKDCRAFSKSVILLARRTFSSKINKNFIPLINLTLDFNSYINETSLLLKHNYTSTILNYDELKLNSENLIKLESNRLIKDLPNHQNSILINLILSVSSFIVCIILISYLISIKIVKKKSSKNKENVTASTSADKTDTAKSSSKIVVKK